MPTQTRRKPNEQYNTKLYGNTGYYSAESTAYDIPTAFPENPGKQKKHRTLYRVQNEKKAKAKLKRRVALLSAFFILCVTTIYRYEVILDCNQRINDLESERDNILAVNQSLQTRIDKQLEMTEIEKYAKNNLGMTSPDSHQVFYIDMKMDDCVSNGRASAVQSDTVNGTPGALVNAFNVLK